MADVISLGEVLADLVPEGRYHILRPGGAPSNVAVNLSRLGVRSAVLSCVGTDFLGDFLISFLQKNGVDTSLVTRTDRGKTGLVFVFMDRHRDRDFSFYGEPSSDKFLSAADVSEKAVRACRLLHFGSISMMHPVSRAASLKALRLAKKHSKLISYDPNVRLNLWEGRQAAAKREIRKYFRHADIIKLSEPELGFLFNVRPSGPALKRIFGKKIVFVSAGKKGCYAYRPGFFAHVPGYRARAVDSTGAGDAFMAGIIRGMIREKGTAALTAQNLLRIASFANRLGAAAVARKGAV